MNAPPCGKSLPWSQRCDELPAFTSSRHYRSFYCNFGELRRQSTASSGGGQE
jgi:hypothetical protein